MKQRVLRAAVVASFVLAVVGAAAPASAAPPIGGANQHPHHVDTPAGCVDIDAVLFNAEDRGLHRGSNASGVDRGPLHASCG